MVGQSDDSTIFERRPRLVVMTLMAAVFLLLDGMVSIAADLLREQPDQAELQRAEMDPNKGYRRRSPIYHHDLRPFTSVDNAVWGDRRYRIRTDSLGFKSDRVKSTPLDSDQHRVIIIGDSFTEGIGVEYADTFAGRVATALAPHGVDVLNAGVSSYSPIIYWRKLKYLIEEVGLDVDEVVVFLDISDIEDEAKVWRLSDSGNVEEKNTQLIVAEPEPTPGLKGFIQRRFILTYFVLDTVYDSLSPARRQYLIDQDRSRWTVDAGLMESYGRDGLANAERHLTMLKELLRSRGIELTLAVYPWPDQIVNGDLDSIQVTHWDDWADRQQVRLLNYFPCFVRPDAIDETLQDYFIRGDSHWNEAGHQLVAEQFLAAYPLANKTDSSCLTVQ